MAAASPFVEISKAFLDNLLVILPQRRPKRHQSTRSRSLMVSFVFLFFFFITRQNDELFFYKFKTNQALLFSVSLFNVLSLFFIIEWFASQTKFKTVIQEMEKEELNEFLCCQARRRHWVQSKVLSLKAIRAAIDRYLRQPPNNKPWSIVGDSAFQKSNKVINAVCKQLMQKGKFGPTIHKNPITSEQLQQLYETGQLNSASGRPWIRLNSSALHGFT